jgi:hypothetical protein
VVAAVTFHEQSFSTRSRIVFLKHKDLKNSKWKSNPGGLAGLARNLAFIDVGSWCAHRGLSTITVQQSSAAVAPHPSATMATGVVDSKNKVMDAGAESEQSKPVKPRPLKHGFFQRMRRRGQQQQSTIHEEVEADPDQVDRLVEDAPYGSETRQDFTNEAREIASKSKDAKVLMFTPKYRSVTLKKEVPLEKPPTAREAAYGGPPRYDWIDIVSLP